eukprot:scaffold3001_cov122-Cylindrotheca_fusiformis.AAC.15
MPRTDTSTDKGDEFYHSGTGSYRVTAWTEEQFQAEEAVKKLGEPLQDCLGLISIMVCFDTRKELGEVWLIWRHLSVENKG